MNIYKGMSCSGDANTNAPCELQKVSILLFSKHRKMYPPIQNIECLMKSERSFVTVQRIDGVEIPP